MNCLLLLYKIFLFQRNIHFLLKTQISLICFLSFLKSISSFFGILPFGVSLHLLPSPFIFLVCDFKLSSLYWSKIILTLKCFSVLFYIFIANYFEYSKNVSVVGGFACIYQKKVSFWLWVICLSFTYILQNGNYVWFGTFVDLPICAYSWRTCLVLVLEKIIQVKLACLAQNEKVGELCTILYEAWLRFIFIFCWIK